MSRRLLIQALLVSVLAGLLSGCGGGDAPPPPAPMIGPAGGTVTGPNGAQVVIPAGALAADTAIAVTQSAAGSPALPAGTPTFGAVYAFTPHGTTFALPVTITVPFDAASVPAGVTPFLFKTNAAGAWERVPNATVSGGTITAQVSSFSWGVPAPLISVAPADVAVTEPASATFSVTALGVPPFTYQWEKSDDGGTNFVAIGGATDRTYTTGATTVATDNGDRYRALVSNDPLDPNATSTSSAAILTVTAMVIAPAITSQPQSVAVTVGVNASFSVVATGTNLVYQWQKNGTPIAGQTNASLNLVNVQAVDAGSYTVVTSNLVNGAPVNSVTSSAATLTVSTAPPVTGVTRIAAGSGASTAVNAAGVPYTWGASDVLGSPGTTDRLIAAPMGTLNAVRAVSAGGIATVAVRTDGTVWAWGYRGSIDCNFGVSAPTPFQIAGAANVASLSAGSDFTLLLGNDGVVRVFGCNFDGQLGRAGTNPAPTPVPVAGLPATITAVAAGRLFALALDGGGNVWAWGRGALGDGTALMTSRFTPTQIPGLTGVKAIAAGSDHALAVKTDGSVWAWGSNSNGKLGDGTELTRLTPVATLLTSGVDTVSVGSELSLALRSDGIVMSWGINETGQLGSGSSSPGYRVTPAAVIGLTQVTAIDASKTAGLAHCLALRSDGSLYAWGWNMNGQLGNGGTNASATPLQVTGLNLN